MSDNDPILWHIILQLILILLNAVFSCAEIAIITINDNKLAKLAASGDKRAIRLTKLTSQPGRFLATIQVGYYIGGFSAVRSRPTIFQTGFTIWMVGVGVKYHINAQHHIADCHNYNFIIFYFGAWRACAKGGYAQSWQLALAISG